MFILIVLFSLPARSQTDCAFALDKAQNSYEEGVFQNIPELLLGCMEEGFSKDEKLRAYKLLIMTYLFDDKQEKAEELMLEFLDNYPEYNISPADPVEFKHLFEDYNTVPIYSFGILFGGNFTDALIHEPYAVSNLNQYDGDYKPSGMGFQVGLRVNRYLKKDLEINAQISYTQNSIQYSSSEYDFLSVSKKETFSNLSLPITATYDFHFGSITPYLRSGLALDYNFSSSGLFRRSYSENIGLTEVTGPELDLTPNRKEFYLSYLIGGGLKYGISKGYLVFDLSTNIGLYNFVNTENRYTDQSSESIYKYFYIDDDFSVNRMFISIGYVRRLYKTYKK